MKKTILGAIALAIGLMTAPVANASDWYVKAEVGVTADTQVDTSFGSIELGDDFTYGGYVGTSVGPFRVEAGASHIGGDANFFGIPLETSAVDLNATAYLDTASGFYVGAGVDYVLGEASVASIASADFSGYGWHASGGYAFEAAGGVVEVQGTYRAVDLGEVDLSGPAFTVGYRRAI